MQLSASLARPASLTEQVLDSLEQSIRDGVYQPRERLPTEKQLAERYGVSRAVVREAIARLKSDGYVETRQGAGAFVATRPGARSFKLTQPGRVSRDDLRHILELRLAVETEAASLAASRRTPHDLEVLSRCVERMQQMVQQRGDGSDADNEFHRAIGTATHNPHMRRFIEFLNQQFAETRRPAWSEQGHDSGMADGANREHRRILEAIAAGDGGAARRAAQRHLRSTARRMDLALEPSRP